MVPELIPALLCQDEDTFRERLELVDGFVEWIQLDILDNTLYPNTCWADPAVIESWPIQSNLELHLMVADPAAVMRAWEGVMNVQRVIWHVETNIDHKALILEAKQRGYQVGLAIAPSTSLDQLLPYLKHVDRVLVLGVEPGQSGQALIPTSLKTIQTLASIELHPTVAFDGGVADNTLPSVLNAGAEAICAASLIFNHPPVDERIEDIRDRLTLSAT